LELIRIAAAEQAKNRVQASMHPSGLYLDRSLAVRGGPLFSRQDAGDPVEGDPDYGWAAIAEGVGKARRN
jgi:hypothetical protein